MDGGEVQAEADAGEECDGEGDASQSKDCSDEVHLALPIGGGALRCSR
jgi:hypothetical protein